MGDMETGKNLKTCSPRLKQDVFDYLTKMYRFERYGENMLKRVMESYSSSKKLLDDFSDYEFLYDRLDYYAHGPMEDEKAKNIIARMVSEYKMKYPGEYMTSKAPLYGSFQYSCKPEVTGAVNRLLAKVMAPEEFDFKDIISACDSLHSCGKHFLYYVAPYIEKALSSENEDLVNEAFKVLEDLQTEVAKAEEAFRKDRCSDAKHRVHP